MPETDVQAVLDSVATELGAPMTLEDRDFRLLAHTDHSDGIDEVRQAMIVGRRVTPTVRAWFEQFEPNKADRPFQTPADRTLGVLERWCVPVSFRGVSLGCLWVLDTRGIEESELGGAIEAADQIGALLYRRRLSSQADADLLRLLITPSPGSEGVAAEARSLGSYPHKGLVAVVVVDPATEQRTPTGLSDVTLVMQRAAEQVSSDAVLAADIAGLGVLLVPLRRRDDSASRRLAETVRRLAQHVSSDLDLLTAIGGPQDLEHASQSYAEARRTLRMIRAMPDLGPIAAWDDLGVFRALAHLPTGDLQSEVLDPRVRRLLADDTLAATAEAFLDLAGDVQRTAASLFVHRATLYQRLDRIAALYELDLRRSGDHRLLTHLGLKLVRVAAP